MRAEVEEFWDMMPDTIVWERWLSRDAWGNPEYAAAEQIPHCRVQAEFENIRSPEGEEVLHASTVYVGSFTTLAGNPVAIGINDRITLPDGGKPKVLNVNTESDESGPHHIVLRLGSPAGSS